MPAYDDIIQGRSGCAALMQRQTGTPQYFPSIVADKTSGLVAAHAILAALFRRERTGEGSYVEIPMLESMVAFNLVEHFFGAHFDPPLSPPGYSRVLNKWRKPYKTSDGFICALPYTDAHWRRFFVEAGMPEVADDARFADVTGRTTHAAALYELVAQVIERRTTAEWLDVFKRLDIAASRMYALEDLQQDEHLRATGFFETLEDAQMGKLVFPGVPVKFNGVRPSVRMAPRLGEHTAEVMADLEHHVTRP